MSWPRDRNRIQQQQQQQLATLMECLVRSRASHPQAGSTHSSTVPKGKMQHLNPFMLCQRLSC